MYDNYDDATQKPVLEERSLSENTQRVAADLRELVDTVRRDYPIGKYYEENPYVVLAAAAGVGYVLAGGLFSPFTRRLMRIGMKALVIPMATNQLKGSNSAQDPNIFRQ